MAGMALIVAFGILEDKTVCALQAIWALFHTVRTVLKMDAFYTMLGALQK